jgi:hypothetical protein
MAQITSLNLLDVERFESPEILKKLALSSRRLAAWNDKRVLIGNTKAPMDTKRISTLMKKA